MIWLGIIVHVAFGFVLDGLRGAFFSVVMWPLAVLIVPMGAKVIVGGFYGAMLGSLLGPVLGGAFGKDTFLEGEPSIALEIAHYFGMSFGQEVIGGFMLGVLNGAILGAVIGFMVEKKQSTEK